MDSGRQRRIFPSGAPAVCTSGRFPFLAWPSQGGALGHHGTSPPLVLSGAFSVTPGVAACTGLRVQKSVATPSRQAANSRAAYNCNSVAVYGYHGCAQHPSVVWQDARIAGHTVRRSRLFPLHAPIVRGSFP